MKKSGLGLLLLASIRPVVSADRLRYLRNILFLTIWAALSVPTQNVSPLESALARGIIDRAQAGIDLD